MLNSELQANMHQHTACTNIAMRQIFKKTDKSLLNVGDVIFIVGLYIIIGSGFISINNYNNRVLINTPKIRHIVSQIDLSYSLPNSKSNYALYERAPRKNEEY